MEIPVLDGRPPPWKFLVLVLFVEAATTVPSPSGGSLPHGIVRLEAPSVQAFLPRTLEEGQVYQAVAALNVTGDRLPSALAFRSSYTAPPEAFALVSRPGEEHAGGQPPAGFLAGPLVSRLELRSCVPEDLPEPQGGDTAPVPSAAPEAASRHRNP